MSGRASRQKGMRGEYLVRDYFRQLGAEAHRVPLSGASQGFKGDVQVTFPGEKPFYIEVKKRRKEFDTVYRLVATIVQCQSLIKPRQVVALRSVETYLGYAIGFNFFDTRAARVFYLPLTSEELLLVRKLAKMCDKWLEGCDYLVIQGDRKPLLFIKRV